ncbi:urea carboxylase-associated family protein [Limosilactobacillus sp. WILCCON 0053]|uniref:Urea carboxylase-associated family protein n=1 Tax=Limosilactobacillus allomucosae TaxID=3142938 RepID=A0ABV0I7E2_9LACO
MKKVISEDIVAGGYGQTFKVKANQTLTIIDLEGEQVVDFTAFCQPDDKEFLSMSRSRAALMRKVFTTGDTLYTNLSKPMLVIEEDTFGIHDSTYSSCDSADYLRYGGITNHRNCKQNFIDNLAPYGIEEWRLPDPWNIFQNTPDMSSIISGAQADELKHSKAGDSITLRFLRDSLVAISACPFTLKGFNGGKATPVKVVIQEEAE